MCGIVGFLDKTGRGGPNTGRIVVSMLDALACRGPDSAGLALMRDESATDLGVLRWSLRVAPVGLAIEALAGLEHLGTVVSSMRSGDTLVVEFEPAAGLSISEVEKALGARRGGLEVLCLGHRLDLVKQVGSPAQLEATYGVSGWAGPLAIGHTRLSTESKIDLSHSQPFWAHGLADLATVHNGHVTNYHLLRRKYEQKGVTFYTDNDSEVIGVYLRDRIEGGRTLTEALGDSLRDLDGAYNYLVATPEGIGVVRDRCGFKPLMVAETDEFVAIATEEIALRRALPGGYRASEPAPATARFYPLPAHAFVHA
jgi:glutamate synthase domain-containing protein 1